MKTSYLAGVFILVSVLSSCMWGVPNKHGAGKAKDTLVYTYQTIKNRAADCGNKSDSGCTMAKINYPLFKNAKLLNDSVTEKLTNLFEVNKTDTSLQLMSTNFLKSYNDFKKNDSKNDTRKFIFFNLDSYAQVLRQDSDLVALEVAGYEFTGGAHGITSIHFINWDVKANKNLQLSDILSNGSGEKLTKTGEAIFRKQEKLSDTASLARDYFFKDHKFSLNQNFSITPLGLRFLYNQYEIKPYAAGQTILLIPYSQIKSLLRPNTVVSQYIK